MTKRIPDPQKPPTYFEQIPLEVVTKIAVREISKKPKADAREVTREPSSRKTEPYSIGAHRFAE